MAAVEAADAAAATADDSPQAAHASLHQQQQQHLLQRAASATAAPGASSGALPTAPYVLGSSLADGVLPTASSAPAAAAATGPSSGVGAAVAAPHPPPPPPPPPLQKQPSLASQRSGAALPPLSEQQLRGVFTAGGEDFTPVWFYIDPKDRLQGPFSAEQMVEWVREAMLGPNTPVCGAAPGTEVRAGGRGVCGVSQPPLARNMVRCCMLNGAILHDAEPCTMCCVQACRADPASSAVCLQQHPREQVPPGNQPPVPGVAAAHV